MTCNVCGICLMWIITTGIQMESIDHFIVSNRVFNKCCSGGVTHSMDNTSNHSVINMSLEMNTFVLHNVECEKTVTSKLPGIKPVYMI